MPNDDLNEKFKTEERLEELKSRILFTQILVVLLLLVSVANLLISIYGPDNIFHLILDTLSALSLRLVLYIAAPCAVIIFLLLIMDRYLRTKNDPSLEEEKLEAILRDLGLDKPGTGANIAPGTASSDPPKEKEDSNDQR